MRGERISQIRINNKKNFFQAADFITATTENSDGNKQTQPDL